MPTLITRLLNWIMGRQTIGLDDERLYKWLGIDPRGYNRRALNEITYFTCMKMLCESMGKLPLKYYRQSMSGGRIRAQPTAASRLLTVRPNPYMTPTTMWTAVEFNTQQFGNGFVWIRGVFNAARYGGSYDILDLWPLKSKDVTILVDDAGWFGKEAGGIYYKYTDPTTSQEYVFSNDEIMHFKTWFSYDGITGLPVREILRETVEGAVSSQYYLNNMYNSGFSQSVIVQYTGDLNDKKREALAKRLSKDLTGINNAGKVIPVPVGLTVTPIKMTMADAEYTDLRRYTALQIAGAFGIKPNQINDLEKSSYSSVEAQNLAFLVDTMLYRIKAYEEEINAKILSPAEFESGFYYKFNERVLLRADAATQMKTVTAGVNNGVYTPNEARELLDLPHEEGGDQLIVNGNYIPLTMVGEQYGGNGDGSD